MICSNWEAFITPFKFLFCSNYLEFVFSLLPCLQEFVSFEHFCSFQINQWKVYFLLKKNLKRGCRVLKIPKEERLVD